MLKSYRVGWCGGSCDFNVSPLVLEFGLKGLDVSPLVLEFGLKGLEPGLDNFVINLSCL